MSSNWVYTIRTLNVGQFYICNIIAFLLIEEWKTKLCCCLNPFHSRANPLPDPFFGSETKEWNNVITVGKTATVSVLIRFCFGQEIACLYSYILRRSSWWWTLMESWLRVIRHYRSDGIDSKWEITLFIYNAFFVSAFFYSFSREDTKFFWSMGVLALVC